MFLESRTASLPSECCVVAVGLYAVGDENIAIKISIVGI